jgi:hypothetical protein
VVDAMAIGRYAVSRQAYTPGPDVAVQSELVLWVDQSRPGALAGATLTFSDVPATPGSQQGTWIFVDLPSEEFDAWYRIVRHERPVSLVWDAAGTGVVTYVALRTGDEPLGEGVDTSPP